MNVSKQADSKGAVRWLKRAEALAKGIKARTGSKRNILDGYLVEGRRNNRNRLARVIDLPGWFVPFSNTLTSNNLPGQVASWWPRPVGAPTRRDMLEAAPPVSGDPIGFEMNHDTGAYPLLFRFIGTPPAVEDINAGLASTGISTPTTSADWLVQTRTVFRSTDGLPVVDIGDPITIDYRNITGLWVLVNAWSASNRGAFAILINETVLTGIFGAPIIRRERSGFAMGSDARAWGVVLGYNKVAVAVWLSDGAPAGQTGSLGVVIYEEVEGTWVVATSYRLTHDDMPRDIFKPHWRMGSNNEPIEPPQRSALRPRDPTIMADGKKLVFTGVLRHELDARVDVGYRPLVITGVLRVEIDLESYAASAVITDVNTDAELHWDDIGTEDNLVTSNGILVSGAIDYPWDAGEWAVHSWMHYDSVSLYEVLGFARGVRGDVIRRPGFAPTGGHTYQEDTIRFQFTTTTRVGDQPPTTTEVNMLTNSAAYNAMTAPGSLLHWPSYPVGYTGPAVVGMLDGGNGEMPMAYCGMGVYEMPLYRGAGTARIIARIDSTTGTVSEAPMPARSHATVSCYAQKRIVETDAGEVEIPHRTVLTYVAGGITTVEVRSGDDVIMRSKGTTLDYRVGVYYLGNPFAVGKYGLMEADV